jgi:hypothetical protein
MFGPCRSTKGLTSWLACSESSCCDGGDGRCGNGSRSLRCPLGSGYPALQQRLDDVESVIYPSFASCDQEAQVEQNRYRWFTVLAILGGLLTTTFGAVQAWLQSVAWPGVVVATLGAATSAITTVARRQGSLDNYLSARIRAERLRSLAFEHLARAPEASEAGHRQQLRELEHRAARIESGPVT